MFGHISIPMRRLVSRYHTDRSARDAKLCRAAHSVEMLEPRRLLSYGVSLDGGTLTISQATAADASHLVMIEMQASPDPIYKFSDTGITFNAATGSGAANVTNNGNNITIPTTDVSKIVITLGDGSDAFSINATDDSIASVSADGGGQSGDTANVSTQIQTSTFELKQFGTITTSNIITAFNGINLSALHSVSASNVLETEDGDITVQATGSNTSTTDNVNVSDVETDPDVGNPTIKLLAGDDVTVAKVRNFNNTTDIEAGTDGDGSGKISESGSSGIQTRDLLLLSESGVTATGFNNVIANELAGGVTGTGNFSFNTGESLQVGTAAGHDGITTHDGTISVEGTTDGANLQINKAISAGNGKSITLTGEFIEGSFAGTDANVITTGSVTFEDDKGITAIRTDVGTISHIESNEGTVAIDLQDSDNSGVTVSNAQTNGDFEFTGTVGSGKRTFSSVHGIDEINIEATAGDIAVKSLGADNISVKADSGSITITGDLEFDETAELTASRSITEVKATASTDLAGGFTIDLDAGTGIGDHDHPLQLKAGSLNAHTDAGGIAISNVGFSQMEVDDLTSGDTPVYLASGQFQFFGSDVVSDKAALSLGGVDVEIEGETIGSLAGGGQLHLHGILNTGGDNTTTTYNGQIDDFGGITKSGTGAFTLGNSHLEYTGATTVAAGTLLVNGELDPNSDISVQAGATLGGTGHVNYVTSTGGTISPGRSPGILNTGDVDLDSASKLQIEINGLTAGSGYDQLKMNGSIALANATLTGTLGISPIDALGKTFVIIRNTTSDPNTGTFKNVPQGGIVTIGGFAFVVNYAFDADGDAANNDVAITGFGAGIISDPTSPGKTAILIGGTAGNDNIQLTAGTGSNTINVKIGSSNFGPFSPSGHILMLGQDGNDTITVDKKISIPQIVFGGAGNDHFIGSNTSGLFVGGEGNDTAEGGNSVDIFIGGNGADVLKGNSGTDLLIGGRTSFDDPTVANIAAPASIQAEWRSAGGYTANVNHLRGITPGGYNGTNFLKGPGAGQTVFDDAAVDVLSGGSGQDFFFAHKPGAPADTVDNAGGEVLVLT